MLPYPPPSSNPNSPACITSVHAGTSKGGTASTSAPVPGVGGGGPDCEPSVTPNPFLQSNFSICQIGLVAGKSGC